MPNSNPSPNKQDNIKSLLNDLIQEQKRIDKSDNMDCIVRGNADNSVGQSFMLFGLLELKKLIEE